MLHHFNTLLGWLSDNCRIFLGWCSDIFGMIFGDLPDTSLIILGYFLGSPPQFFEVNFSNTQWLLSRLGAAFSSAQWPHSRPRTCANLASCASSTSSFGKGELEREYLCIYIYIYIHGHVPKTLYLGFHIDWTNNCFWCAILLFGTRTGVRTSFFIRLGRRVT